MIRLPTLQRLFTERPRRSSRRFTITRAERTRTESDSEGDPGWRFGFFGSPVVPSESNPSEPDHHFSCDAMVKGPPKRTSAYVRHLSR